MMTSNSLFIRLFSVILIVTLLSPGCTGKQKWEILEGDEFPLVTNRGGSDLGLVRETRRKMKDKPVVVVMHMTNPAVFSEVEPFANAIIVHFGVLDQAMLDVLSGSHEPGGLLPLQMPASMRTVEEQSEDVPHDMEVYSDSEGNYYDFAFGMNWSGPVKDERTARYAVEKHESDSTF